MNSIENDDLSLKLLVVLTRATQTITKQLEADIRKYGLNPTEFAVLELLFHKGDQPIQKIGEKILLASSSLTYVVDKLEKKKLITRKACSKDRRMTYAAITAEGNELLSTIFPQHQAMIHQLFIGLDSSEKKALIEQLKKIGYHAKSL